MRAAGGPRRHASSNPIEKSRSRSCREYTWKLIRVSVRLSPATFAIFLRKREEALLAKERVVSGPA